MIRMLVRGLIFLGSVAWADAAPYAWENRLHGDAIVLLGEVHDNAVQHRLRLEVLQRAFEAGWRPAIAMEQFDREHQSDIDDARRTHPLDADYLIDKASPGHDSTGAGWNWNFYRPYVVLALQYDVPLLAANLSRSDAEKVYGRGYPAVFDDQTLKSLGLDRASDTVISSQEREIDAGHCHAMPHDQLPAMARAQLARDAVMAAVVRERQTDGVVLLAGDGHVRRDIGVAAWLDPSTAARVLAIGFLERGDEPPPADAFDAVVITEPASRPDPCAQLRRK